MLVVFLELVAFFEDALFCVVFLIELLASFFAFEFEEVVEFLALFVLIAPSTNIFFISISCLKKLN